MRELRALKFQPSTPAGRVSFLGAITSIGSSSSTASLKIATSFPLSSSFASLFSPSDPFNDSPLCVMSPATVGASITNFSLTPGAWAGSIIILSLASIILSL
jgi:hypothetical protein